MRLVLTLSGFDKFMTLLDSDREAAGVKFEMLRQRVIKFFEWRDFENAEDLTDIVFDRLINKISEGEQIQNLNAYAASIAQFVLKEELRRRIKFQEIDDSKGLDLAVTSDEGGEDKNEKRFECLEKCLSELPAEERSLVIAYYDTDESTMIEARRRLADSLAISLNTLRIRVCRLKAKLEACTFSCCRGERS